MSNSDNEIDRVEVFVASEAASEIGVCVGSGIELVTEWAKESEESIAMFCGELEVFLNQIIDEDFIS